MLINEEANKKTQQCDTSPRIGRTKQFRCILPLLLLTTTQEGEHMAKDQMPFFQASDFKIRGLPSDFKAHRNSI